MRIALIAPPFLTVPPQGYGGIEQVVALLADGLTERGHDVTLFASGGSRTEADLVSPLAQAPGETALADEFSALSHAIDAYREADRFDVVHDHTVHGTALAAATGRRPVLHTLQVRGPTAPAPTTGASTGGWGWWPSASPSGTPIPRSATPGWCPTASTWTTTRSAPTRTTT
ncbi:MAG TPA: glycosyltransferase [Acidimicrobiales bacterium]|nr:glycosyltransferase [Acidimicrobiales bacterium]